MRLRNVSGYPLVYFDGKGRMDFPIGWMGSVVGETGEALLKSGNFVRIERSERSKRVSE